MKLTLKQSDNLADWYLIERAEHNHTAWFVPIEGGMAFQHSGRISDADVEGTAAEMLAIADAIMARKENCDAYRCAVDASVEPVRFWSPRNSQEVGKCSLMEADELAAEIRRVLAKAVPS